MSCEFRGIEHTTNKSETTKFGRSFSSTTIRMSLQGEPVPMCAILQQQGVFPPICKFPNATSEDCAIAQYGMGNITLVELQDKVKLPKRLLD